MIKKLLVLAVLVAAALWIRSSRYADLLTFESLKANADAIRVYTSSHMIFSSIIYVALYIMVAVLNLPAAAIMSLSGGYIFGLYWGTLMAVGGATLGACGGFLFARYILGSSLNRKYEKQLKRLNSELDANGYLYMLTMRLIPIFPFFIVNTLAGLTKIRLFTFFWTSFIGMIPGGFVYVYAGKSLNMVHSVGDIFSPAMLTAFALIGALMLVTIGFKKLKARR